MDHFSNINYLIFMILLLRYVHWNEAQLSNEYTDFCSIDCQIRFAHLRCLQQYPSADFLHYNDTKDTHCYLQCFLYKTGLMDLKTRGLHWSKFQDISNHMEGYFEEDSCMNTFDFIEPLSGNCEDCYRKLMDFRFYCLELFEITFMTNSSGKLQHSKPLKSIDQSATDFCDILDGEKIVAVETSQYEDISFLSLYKENLQCIFQNFHYLDAYGRIDESEILLSYQEANLDSPKSRAIIKECCHHANAKFQNDFYGNMVLELQNCLKQQISDYTTVYKLRNEISQKY